MKSVGVLQGITSLRSDDPVQRAQVAQLLVEGFGEHWPNAWPDLGAATEEVDESMEEGRISRIALDGEGQVVGWIGGIRQYDGHSWELHPLVVHPMLQGKGIGTALVSDFEEQVAAAGATTIWLGTDDMDVMTSIGEVDLYPNVLEKVAEIRNLQGHPFEFYLRLGYSVVGVIPDANGLGKPDILMAKRVGG
jgi:aminoglycoside 6'-N-acetyltransferase I